MLGFAFSTREDFPKCVLQCACVCFSVLGGFVGNTCLRTPRVYRVKFALYGLITWISGNIIHGQINEYSLVVDDIATWW